MDIVERINELINQKGWSCYELSKHSGIATNTIYGWQNGAVPTLSNIMKVCDALKITTEQFFCKIKSYDLAEDEKKILNEWMTLTDLEKSAILNMIDVFKILKSSKS